MTDRPEERRCPVCGRNELLDFDDHVAACRRRRQLRRQQVAARKARRHATKAKRQTQGRRR